MYDNEESYMKYLNIYCVNCLTETLRKMNYLMCKECFYSRGKSFLKEQIAFEKVGLKGLAIYHFCDIEQADMHFLFHMM